MRPVINQEDLPKDHQLTGAQWECLWVMFLRGPKIREEFSYPHVVDELIEKQLATKVGDWVTLNHDGLLYALNKGMARKKLHYIKLRGEQPLPE